MRKHFRQQMHDAMDASMRKIGQQMPIMVKRTGTHRYRVIDGLERVASLKRVGQLSVLAIIYNKELQRESDQVFDLPIVQITCTRDESASFHFQMPVKYVRTTRKELARAFRRMQQLNPHATLADLAIKTDRTVQWIKRLLRENPA